MAGSRRVTIIDPSGGWRYGFPKILPRWVNEQSMDEWLLSEGYPKQNLDLIPYSRFWERDVDENDLPSDYYERK